MGISGQETPQFDRSKQVRTLTEVALFALAAFIGGVVLLFTGVPEKVTLASACFGIAVLFGFIVVRLVPVTFPPRGKGAQIQTFTRPVLRLVEPLPAEVDNIVA